MHIYDVITISNNSLQKKAYPESLKFEFLFSLLLFLVCLITFYNVISEKVITPPWWTIYNKIKHEFSLNFKKANLENVRLALAGAFLLNVVHKPAVKWLFSVGVAKPKSREWIVDHGDYAMAESPSADALDNILKDTFFPPLWIKTHLFFFDYEKPKEKKE